MNFIVRYMHITTLLLVLVPSINAMESNAKFASNDFDNLEKFDNHLQLTKPVLYPYTVEGYMYSTIRYLGTEARDFWSYEKAPKSKCSATKILRWNNPRCDCRSYNQDAPNSNGHNNNKATDFIHSIILPAQAGQPGFFTIQNPPADWCKEESCAQDALPTYKKTKIAEWVNRNWFTVTRQQGTVVETATVDYKPRETQNFTSLEVTVTEHKPVNVKTIQTRLNKTTCCVNLLACAASAWVAFNYFKGK